MLHFNELRYSKDNKSLIIDVAIDNHVYYENVILDSIVIDTQDTFIVNGPSNKPIYSYSVPEEYDKIYSIPEDCNCSPVKVEEDGSYCFTYDNDFKKHVRLELPLAALGVDCNTMLFVYAVASGVPAVNTPCGLDNNKIIGTVVDLQGVYSGIMSYIREIESDCVIPKNLIDNLLKYKALEVSIRTGNYPLAIKYWNNYFKNIKIDTIKSCGCYG